MCGFAGEFLFTAGRADLDLARAMADKLNHRGPDEEGAFLSSDRRFAIGFHRLSVIDPPGSHQPMHSEDGNLTVGFNGEIYNFLTLRQQLTQDGAKFRTAGDTEVLLHLYQRYGDEMLSHLHGMFAFVLYDAPRGQLLLARDRLGQKPLWYSVLPDRLVFASEAKALLLHPKVQRQLSQKALTLYATMGYIPSPTSAWSGVCKLSPGYLLLGTTQAEEPRAYWSPHCIELAGSHADLLEQVRGTLEKTVREHMVADVPLGALLSGGVDSSIVVALMSKAAGKSGGVRTFTAGFEQGEFDERPAARLVATHCGTDHQELLVRPAAGEMLDRIVEMYDEPFGDSSALPTLMICQAAHERVTVALVGDGGDEVFGGYDRYRALHLAETMSPLKYLGARLAVTALRPWAPKDERNRLRRFVRFADALPYPPPLQYFIYRRLFSPDELTRLFTDEFAAQVDLERPARWFCELFEEEEFEHELQRAQYHDMRTYLPDDLLVKTDIASMGVSLELRAPMLDHDVAVLGLSLPVEMKIRGKYGKMVLREAFADLLPPEVFRRPKRGFAVPLGDWLRNELRDTLVETLLDKGLERRRIFRREALAGLINDHLSGRWDHRHRLWALLIFARWLLSQE